MAQLVVRNLDDDVKARLHERAAQAGRSMEEEVRAILRAAVAHGGHPEKGLGTRIAARFAGLGLDHDMPELKGQRAEPATFDR